LNKYFAVCTSGILAQVHLAVYCATNRKVADSIPDVVIGIFH
jgi:hypothetical protein